MEHISTASLTSTLLEVLEDSTFFIPFSWSISVQLLHFLEQVYKRLKLTLELVKKEMEISKLQQSIAKAIEEKISGDQRRYLLNEQLKAIKKVLHHIVFLV
jgi:ATP-dependent Lon protease